MIQFNLLPDVKIEYLKARRTRNIIVFSSVAVVALCAITIGLISLNVYGLQRNHITRVTEDINTYESDINDISEINKILTVQNQLRTINSLHDEKPVATRLFGYMEQVTPSDISLSRVEVDFSSSSMRVSGQTGSLESVNRFVDTLKFTNIINESEDFNGDSDEILAFSNVVLTSFSRSPSETSFVVNLVFDTSIFDSRSDVALSVPARITTRSEIDRPDDLFQSPEVPEEELMQ